MMKKKILIGSIFAALLIVSMPFISALQTTPTVTSSKTINTQAHSIESQLVPPLQLIGGQLVPVPTQAQVNLAKTILGQNGIIDLKNLGCLVLLGMILDYLSSIKDVAGSIIGVSTFLKDAYNYWQDNGYLSPYYRDNLIGAIIYLIASPFLLKFVGKVTLALLTVFLDAGCITSLLNIDQSSITATTTLQPSTITTSGCPCGQ